VLKHVVAFVPDLMDRSKVSAAPADVRFVKDAASLASAAAHPGVDLVVVDLSKPGALDALRSLPEGLRSIGFGSHVDTALLAAASEAGCSLVLPRSKFFDSVAELLG
jgi:DNA-binding NarL/FixJ family response regulator